MSADPSAAAIAAPARPRALPAIALMAGGCALFGMTDGLAKLIGDSYSAPQQTWARFVFLLLPFVLVLGPRRTLASLRTRRPALQLARGLIPTIGAMVVVIGVRDIPLAEFMAIYFVSPLLVTALAIVLFGERVSAPGWAAVLAGFAGVVIIVRPGAGMLDWSALWPLALAGIGAGYHLLTRELARSEGALSLVLYIALCGTLVTSAVTPFFWRWPDLEGWALLAISGVGHGLGHLLVALAYRRASASTLAPFVYAQLIGAAVFGYLAFGDVPDGPTVLGTAIIIAAGLYLLYRERRRPAPT